MSAPPDPAVSLCFVLKVDEKSLGPFNSCEGLGCEVVLEQREEGGSNGFVWQLPTRIKYSNVKLSRPVSAHSADLTTWIIGFANQVTRCTASITARTYDGTNVATWSLDGVIPVRWTGPSLNPENSKVAVETLELAHHGFLLVGTGS